MGLLAFFSTTTVLGTIESFFPAGVATAHAVRQLTP
jgi:hypothetical protein